MSTFLLILLTSSVGSISHIRLLWELHNLNDNACPCHTNGVQVDKNWLYMSEQPVPIQSLPYSMLKYRRKNQKKFRKNIELLSPTTPSQLSAIDFIDVLRKSCLNLCWISPLWCGLALFQCIAAFPFRTSGSKKSKTSFFFFFLSGGVWKGAAFCLLIILATANLPNVLNCQKDFQNPLDLYLSL